MRTKTVEAKSAEKRKLLRDIVVSAAFNHYFSGKWQAKEILDALQAAGADIEQLREWALWSFHPLGADEAEEKRKRGLLVKAQLKKALIGYQNAIDCFSSYASAPHFGWSESKNMSQRFQELVDMNRYLAHETKLMLDQAASSTVYATKRLGVNWNTPYLYLCKAYVLRFTGWNNREVLNAMTHLITAAKKSVRNRVPRDLRSLLRKAIRKFENDPKNATIIRRLQRAVADPDVPTKLFPPLTADPH